MNTITIRDSAIIRAEMVDAQKNATDYNNINNEGAGGYDGGRREKAALLEREYKIAAEYEGFLAIFPDAATYETIKNAWNAAVKSYGTKISRTEIAAVEQAVGATMAQMQRAKRMYA